MQDKDGPGPIGSMGGIHVEKEVKLDGIVKSQDKPKHGGAGFATVGSIAVALEPIGHGIIKSTDKAQYQGATFASAGSIHIEKEKPQHGIIRGDVKQVEGPVSGGTSEIDAHIKDRQGEHMVADGEKKVRAWMEHVLEEKFSEATLAEALKTGVRLCKALNKVYPNTIVKINDSKVAFAHLENIGNYAKGCQRLGFNKSLIFETADLAEQKNMTLVIDNLLHLGRTAKRKNLHSIVMDAEASAPAASGWDS